MKNTLSPHFHKAVFSAFLGAVIALALCLLFSLLSEGVPALNWLFILTVALFSALASYLTSLRKKMDELEERLERLEYKIDRK